MKKERFAHSREYPTHHDETVMSGAPRFFTCFEIIFITLISVRFLTSANSCRNDGSVLSTKREADREIMVGWSKGAIVLRRLVSILGQRTVRLRGEQKMER